MNAGALKNLIIFQKGYVKEDDLAVKKTDWIDFKKDYAYVNNLSGKEYWAAAVVHQENTVDFIFRYKPYFEKMNSKQFRIVFKGEIYNIVSIDNKRFENKTVKIRTVKNGY